MTKPGGGIQPPKVRINLAAAPAHIQINQPLSLPLEGTPQGGLSCPCGAIHLQVSAKLTDEVSLPAASFISKQSQKPVRPARLARGQPAEQAERLLTGTAYIYVRRTPAGVEPAGRGSP